MDMERDEKGRFLEGHEALASPEAMIEYNKNNGNWNEGKKMGPSSIETKEKQSQSMKEKHQNPTWNEEERRTKISEKLKGHNVSEKTRKILKRKGKYSKKQGNNFEYRALHFMEKEKGVIQVIRSAGSHDIDLTVIWKNRNEENFIITKEEVKSSFKWFNTISKNPLCLLDKDDKEKLTKAFNKGFRIFLIYREPKEKKSGEPMEKQSYIRRIELNLENGVIIKRGEITYDRI